MSSRSPRSERRDGASPASVDDSPSLVRVFPPILWKRNDISSLETCRLVEHSAGWRLEGTTIQSENQDACRMEYSVECDAAWVSRSAAVRGWVGRREIDIRIAHDGAGNWTLADRASRNSGARDHGPVSASRDKPTGSESSVAGIDDTGHRSSSKEIEEEGLASEIATAIDAVAGCIDIDLNFSPATNLIPIRRIALEIGDTAVVRAAWLRFPSFRLELLEQSYTRLGEHEYRYRSANGKFEASLTVDEQGLVVRYGKYWSRATTLSA